jgi:hypothetical protein
MSRLISKAEGFETVYAAYKNINFTAFDFYSVKQSMIDYLQLYFPESFTNFIESDELIAILELFAYLTEVLAYRIDMNASENSIDFAQRKSSVLRLAKLVSYKASRNIPARGLVRMRSISTTERIYDSHGKDLSNTVIYWNDPNNANWKDQFFSVIGRVLQQQFGTVSPDERVQVNNVLFELYPLNNDPLTRGVIGYNAAVTNQSYPMELVSASLDENGPKESRPYNDSVFNILYGNDGLGDSSNLTGFFIYTKQGAIKKQTLTFDGVLPNQTVDLSSTNINNTDIWINNIDPNTGSTVDDGTTSERPSGEWEQVDLANVDNIIFNTNPSRTKYETETLENDGVRIIFGDGEFSDIPSGTFDMWYRTSVNEEIYIPQSAVVDKRGSFTYRDADNRVQTINFAFSLVNALQNNAASEDIEHIRRTAPSVYYSQDRMVNARDYNTFPLRDSSILKLRTVNRTFAGDTKYQSSNDPSFSYQNVKIFGDDLAIFYPTSYASSSAPGTVTTSVLLTNYVQPILSTLNVYVKHIIDYTSTFRRLFNSAETAQILSVFNNVNYPWPVSLIYFDLGISAVDSPDGEAHYPTNFGEGVWVAFAGTIDLTGFDANIVISLSNDSTSYNINYFGKTMVAQSDTTYFFYDNSDQRVLSFDTLQTNVDELVILQANKSVDPTKLLTQPITVNILEVDRYAQGLANAGLPNLNRVVITTKDTSGDSIPDDMLLSPLMNTVYTIPLDSMSSLTSPNKIKLPINYVSGNGDVTLSDGVLFVEGGLNILTVDDVNNTFYVNFVDELLQTTADVTHLITIGDKFIVFTNDGNVDGNPYTVQQVTYSSGYTIVTVEPPSTPLTPAGVGGYISVLNRVNNYITVYDNNGFTTATVNIKQYVYFNRLDVDSDFNIIEASESNINNWIQDTDNLLYKREFGKDQLNFLWKHTSTQMNLVDPATTNIHDMFVVTRPYYTQYMKWVAGDISTKPTPPTPQELRTSYSDLLQNKMISDTVILHPGKLKLLIGSKASPELQAKIKIIRSKNRTLTDNQIKIRIVNIVRTFFNIDQWEFGEQFLFSELSAKIQTEMPSEVSSSVLVPNSPIHVFGDLYQINATEDEILQVDISVADIEIVDSYNSSNLHQNV